MNLSYNKRYIGFFILLIFITAKTNLFSQTPETSIQWTFGNNVTGDHLYEARDYIKLELGFTYTPTSDALDLKIDNSIITAMTTNDYISNQFDPSNISINTSLAVENVEGSAFVGKDGSANYTIPISSLAGINNLVPNLSIGYNSNVSNGMLGLGWNINGLSAITRISKTFFKNGDFTGVNLDGNDRFALDGNRLVLTNSQSTYGADGVEYSTEAEMYERIISHEQDGTGPKWFEVKTGNGSTIEYGKTDDAKQYPISTSTVFCWYISRITDINGNYINFHYRTYKGETVIEYIEYTGNDNAHVSPMNKVQFYYREKLDVNNYYVGGYKLVNQLVCDKILVENNNCAIYNYSFNYYYDSDHKKSKLVEVKYLVNGSEELNSTKIIWNENTNIFDASVVYNIGVPFRRCVGDFNGDGKDEIFVLYGHYDSQGIFNSDTWEMFIVDEFNQISSIGNGTLSGLQSKENEPLHSFDEDNDGIDEIVFSDYNDYYYKYNGGNSITGPVKTIGYVCDYGYRSPTIIQDFNGDGLKDLAAITVNSSGQKSVTFILSTNEVNNDLSNLNAEDIHFIDFNGNGKTDILAEYLIPDPIDDHARDKEIVIYEYNNNGFNVIYSHVLYSIENGEQERPLIFGDFNGDGKTDFLHCMEGTFNWGIAYSTGKYFDSKAVNINLPTPNYLPQVVRDFNGDGIDDILYEYGNSAILYLMYADGSCQQHVFSSTSINTLVPLLTGDFNGDGQIDILAQNDGNGPFDILFRYGDNSRYVSKIYDGFMNNVNFTMSPISQNSYTKGTSSDQGIINIQMPMYVVSSTLAFDKNNIPHSIRTYTYEGLKFHIANRSLLGFTKTIDYDNILGTYTSTQYSVFGTYKQLYNTYTENGTFELGNPSNKTKTASSTINYSPQVFGFTDGTPYEYYREQVYPSLITNQDFVNNIKKTKAYDPLGGNLSNFGTYSRKESSTVCTYPTLSASTPDQTIITGNGYDYAPFNNWNAVQLAKTKTIISSPGQPDYSRTKQYLYNSNYTGSLWQEIQDPDVTAMTVITQYENYDNFGHPLKISTLSDPANNLPIIQSQVQFDNTGRFVINTTNPLNQIEHVEYNSLGQVVKSINKNNLTTTYEYDNLNRRKKVNNPDGTYSEIEFDWISNSASYLYSKTTSSSGNPPSVEYYDVLSRLLRTENHDLTNQTVFSDITYNNKGQVLQKSLPYFQGNTAQNTTFTYDNLGRIYTTNLPDGSVTENDYSEKQTINKITKNGTTQQKTTNYNDLGQEIMVTDNMGNSVYNLYNNAGLLRASYVIGGEIIPNDSYPHIGIEYDLHGNRTSLNDPSAGLTTSVYDAYNRLVSNTDANQKTTTYTYDLLSRMLTETNNDGATTWEYDSKSFGKGLLSKVSNPDVMFEYTYDNLSRLSSSTETIGSKSFQSVYNYDSYSRLSNMTYPDGSGFAVSYSYQNGQLHTVNNSLTNSLIWQANFQDNIGSYNDYTYGNSQNTHINRDILGRVTEIKTKIGSSSPVQSWDYDYDLGNMWHRTDNISSQKETFYYDFLNRLKYVVLDNSNVSNYLSQAVNYDIRGNITTKMDVGTYNYENTAKPDVLTKITDNPGTITTDHVLHYYISGKTKDITQGLNKLEFTYGPDIMRAKTVLYNNNIPQKTKYFALGNYEEETDEITGITTKYYYIFGGDGLAAIYKQVGTASGTMLYVHKDILGSIDLLTDANGSVFERYAYDVWGNRRNPGNWQLPDTRTNLAISRGYIGQEHLDVFGLINLNGRIYEPLTARFLSPDNFVSSSTYSQSFNRYAYGFNNPLSFKDPNGEFAWFIPVIACAIIGAEIGGTWEDNWVHWAPWEWSNQDKSWKAAGIGFIVGAGIGLAASSIAMDCGANITMVYHGVGAGTTTLGWDMSENALMTANIDMLSSYIQGRDENEILLSGVSGLAAGAIGGAIGRTYIDRKGYLDMSGIRATNYITGTINGALDRLTNSLYNKESSSQTVTNTIFGAGEGLYSAYLFSGDDITSLSANGHPCLAGRYISSALTQSITSVPGLAISIASYQYSYLTLANLGADGPWAVPLGFGAYGIAPPFYGWAINKYLYTSAVVNPLFWLDKHWKK